MTDAILRICVIGCGQMSTFAHGPSCAMYAAQHPGVQLTACCDLDEAKAEDYRARFGFAHRYTDYARMLAEERPSVVCLAVPEPVTCGLACRVLEMGHPLITEKPPGRTVQEIDQMISAAETAGVPTRVAFNRRYAPLSRELRGVIESKVGSREAQHFECEFTRVGRKDPDFSLTAIHGIDTVRFLSGADYKHIRFHYQDLAALGPTVANVFMDCALTSGATAHLSFCPATGVSTERTTVHCPDATFVLEIPRSNEWHPTGELRHYEKGRLVRRITGAELSGTEEQLVLSGFYEENASFFDDVRGGRKSSGDLQDARQSVLVAECMRERRPEYDAGDLEL